MGSYNVFSFVSVNNMGDPSTLLHVPVVYSFSALGSILSYEHSMIYISILLNGHLGQLRLS